MLGLFHIPSPPHPYTHTHTHTHTHSVVREKRSIIGSLAIRNVACGRERVEAAVEAARRRVDAAEMAALPRCELVSGLRRGGRDGTSRAVVLCHCAYRCCL